MDKILALLALTFLLGCRDPKSRSDCEPSGDTVDWAEARSLIRSCCVVAASQTHDLSVGLRLTDGTTVQTTEPQIDAVFDEIDSCGTCCSEIVKVTE